MNVDGGNLSLDSQHPLSLSYISLRHLTLKRIYLALQVRSVLLLDVLITAKSKDAVRTKRKHTLGLWSYHPSQSITLYSWNEPNMCVCVCGGGVAGDATEAAGYRICDSRGWIVADGIGNCAGTGTLLALAKAIASMQHIENSRMSQRNPRVMRRKPCFDYCSIRNWSMNSGCHYPACSCPHLGCSNNFASTFI